MNFFQPEKRTTIKSGLLLKAIENYYLTTNNIMSLVACLILSAYLMNPSGIPVDSLKTKPTKGINIGAQTIPAVKEMIAKDGATLKYSTDAGSLKVGKIKFVSVIHFEIGQSTLNKPAKDELTKFSEILIKNPTIKISIVGHTDNINSLELNQKLSKRRALAVADFLLSRNVNSVQLKEITGKNFAEPVADNSTEAGRAANRRVEVYIVLSPVATNNSDVSQLSADSIKTNQTSALLKKLIEQVVHKQVKSNDVELEIDGLLVDDTKTKAGKDFYDLFYNSWEAPPAAKNFSITVSEKPFRLTSTLIVISIDDNIIYQDILQPRQELIEAQTADAISVTQNYLANYAEITKQMNGDDQAGSGIY